MGLVFVNVISPLSSYSWQWLTRTNRITEHFIRLPPVHHNPLFAVVLVPLYTRISFLSASQCDFIAAVFCRPQIVMATFRTSLDKIYPMSVPFCNAAKSDCWLRHVRLSVRTEQLGCHRTDFCKMLYSSIFKKLCPENWSFNEIWQE